MKCVLRSFLLFVFDGLIRFVWEEVWTEEGLGHVDWGLELLIPLDDLFDSLGGELFFVKNLDKLRVTDGFEHWMVDFNRFHGKIEANYVYKSLIRYYALILLFYNLFLFI